MEKLKQYKKEFTYTYTLGPFPTFELINSRPELVDRVILSEKFNELDKIISILNENSIPFSFEPRTLDRIGNKKKIYVAGVLKKYDEKIKEGNHLVLDNISDMGNLGTIIRTMVAFGIKDLALIGNSCDIFNPKVIRGSMGALFKIRFEYFKTIEDYIKKFNNNKYAFILDEGSKNVLNTTIVKPYSLIFGNEGSGLGKEYYRNDIEKIIIEQSSEVDSLNLPIAIGIGIYTIKNKE
ncbi:TrmH family RNA methyltransferase [Miniphocaeibacter halophilus]|uniref:TrmH family RNA methyltransferase n=1 Tax=Miniphocaeibacter halophilus TaxID=2931922 RepID=A0AC61MTN1_9FIRM|nr:TrmH family RNA methyltransferase [Miniphocaeibacter halophilus]QQK08174.1 TrmH family RNA methyltransferase [Miniphocaeibacter halophilus]